jgi:DNA-binding response OmpR family regulator
MAQNLTTAAVSRPPLSSAPSQNIFPMSGKGGGHPPSGPGADRTKHTGLPPAEDLRQFLLIVDDDRDIREMLSDYLEAEGYSVDSVATGEDALQRMASRRYRLIILDIMLPGMSGLDVLRKLQSSSEVPVLMLTARGEAADRVLGLRLGADDYLPKPFVPQELAARVEAILRRAERIQEVPVSVLEVGDVSLDPKLRLAKRQGEPIELTTAEFDLLRVFLVHAGRVVSREQLQREVLGRESTPFDRSIDTHVCNLRKKLGATVEGIERIKSVRGSGYLYGRPSLRNT